MFGFRGAAFSYVCLGIVLFPIVWCVLGIPLAISFLIFMIITAIRSHLVVENSPNVKKEKLRNGKIKPDSTFLPKEEIEYRKKLILEVINEYYESNDYLDLMDNEIREKMREKDIDFAIRCDINNLNNIWLESTLTDPSFNVGSRNVFVLRDSVGKTIFDDKGIGIWYKHASKPIYYLMPNKKDVYYYTKQDSLEN